MSSPPVRQSRVASVDNISFTDYDLDFGDIGGLVSWDKPLDESKVGWDGDGVGVGGVGFRPWDGDGVGVGFRPLVLNF